MYAIQATITIASEWGGSSRQVPTFYLDERVQGILSAEHAEQVAHAILTATQDIAEETSWALGASPDPVFHITAIKI